LLVSVYEDGDFLEKLFGHEGNELIGALLKTHVVGRVHDVDNAVSVLVIVLPVGTNLTLTTNVPDIEFEAVLGLSYTGAKHAHIDKKGILIRLTNDLMLNPWVGIIC
jgi:hypothetical protein